MGSAFHRVRGILLFFLKVVYLLPFFIFGLWLISVVYFPGFGLNASVVLSKYNGDADMLKLVTHKSESTPREHFHMIDQYVDHQEPNPPICVVCHGTYPHGKEKKVRALLNLHTGFIACAVCHARQDENAGTELDGSQKEKIDFLWVDRKTGEIENTVKGEYGKYPAKIYPIKFTKQGPSRIFTPIKTEAAQQFLKMRPDLTSDQVAEAKAKLHGPLSKKPVFCADCHQKNGYLDFKKLGFPERRVEHLVSSEFVGMIDKYKTFYLPSVLDFSKD